MSAALVEIASPRGRWTEKMSGLEATAVSILGSDSPLPLLDPMLDEGLGLGLFVGLMVGAIALVPLLASILRRGLPERRRASIPLEPVSFGSSQKARRSPRHAVLIHRGLVGSFFMALLALFLMPAAASLSALGGAVIPAALAFVLPTLLVTLHARRRSTRE